MQAVQEECDFITHIYASAGKGMALQRVPSDISSWHPNGIGGFNPYGNTRTQVINCVVE